MFSVGLTVEASWPCVRHTTSTSPSDSKTTLATRVSEEPLLLPHQKQLIDLSQQIFPEEKVIPAPNRPDRPASGVSARPRPLSLPMCPLRVTSERRGQHMEGDSRVRSSQCFQDRWIASGFDQKNEDRSTLAAGFAPCAVLVPALAQRARLSLPSGTVLSAGTHAPGRVGERQVVKMISGNWP